MPAAGATASTPTDAGESTLDRFERFVEQGDAFLESVVDLLETIRNLKGEGGG